jgi:hypothetical protein
MFKIKSNSSKKEIFKYTDQSKDNIKNFDPNELVKEENSEFSVPGAYYRYRQM